MEGKKIRNGMLLFLTSIIWGISFVAQTVSMDNVGPYTFTGVRFLLGGAVLLPLIVHTRKKHRTNAADKREGIVAGLLCGVILFAATMLQQYGVMTTSAGKSGFITALYIIIVPVISLFFHKKQGSRLWFSVCLALIGMYLLCMKESDGIRIGDVLLFSGAILFSVHILVIDHFADRVDGVELSAMQFFVCGILGCIGMFLSEQPEANQILAAWQPILYSGVLSCGVGYTLQVVGQKGMNPTVCSLILSLESVNAAIAGALLLGQVLSRSELIGCGFVFGGIILAQLPPKKIKHSIV